MPREIEDGTDIDRDDRGLDGEEMPYEKLMAMLQAGDDDEGADVAFGEGESKKAELPAVVSVEDGIDLIDQAAQGKSTDAKVEAPKADDPLPPKGEDTQPATGEDSAPAAAPDDLDTLLTGLDDTKRTTIKARVQAADEVMGIFKGREAELERHGVKPVDAMKRLIDLNAYANANPTEYVAWAATQLGNPEEVLSKAAEKFGLKLVPAASEEDPFEDPEIKAIREENRRLKAAFNAPQIGPDAPQNRAQQDLQAFTMNAPHFQKVAPYVAAQARTYVETTGKVATLDDIKRFYDAAVIAHGLQPAPAPESLAAQAPAPVAQPQETKPAAPSASVQRAKAASKSLDGSGQGAGRRPALDPDMSLSDTLKALYEAQTKG